MGDIYDLNDLINEFNELFEDYLGYKFEGNGLRPSDNPEHYLFSHPGLNCRYGIELEFISSANKYVIGSRINSCMYESQDKWWRKNFNGLRDIDPILPGDGKDMTDNIDDFNQWSSFFFEITHFYGSKTHKGDHRCSNRGIAGIKIENDSSVVLDSEGPGIILWSSKVDDNFNESELKNDNGTWKANCVGLNEPFVYIEPNRERIMPFCKHFVLKGRNQRPLRGVGGMKQGNVVPWNSFASKLELMQENELVTNVLSNDYIIYPFCSSYENDYVEGILPLGSLVIDNTINHMISHTTVIATQRMAFHVHLSEFPTADNERRINSAIGFVKMFYLFEPLLFSLQPYFRSKFAWNQSIQSLYTYQEILHIEHMRDILLRPSIDRPDLQYYGSQRCLQGDRYVAVNLQNLTGSGTIEVRIGNATFDSHFIQAYINVLQTLYTFSNMLLDNNYQSENIFQDHNNILEAFEDKVIPFYCCEQNSIDYNNRPARNIAITPENPGSPIYGFFDSFGYEDRQKNEKTNIIGDLYMLFIGLTGCEALHSIRDYINYYHCSDSSWINKVSINCINFDILENDARDNFRKDNLFTFNFFSSVRGGENYFTGGNDFNNSKFIDVRCKNCYQDRYRCVADFNRGIYPNLLQRHREGIFNRDRRTVLRNMKDQSSVFKDTCPRDNPDFPNLSKLQKELIHRVIQRGGSNSESTKMETDIKDRLNKCVYKIIIRQNNDNIEIGYVDWMGTFYKEEALTEIIKELLDKEIINREQLNILVKNKYIDYCIFKKEHKTQLIEELQNIKNLNITESIINKIIEIYNKIYEKYKKKSKTTGSVVTKLSKRQFKFRQPFSSSKNRSTTYSTLRNNKYKKKQVFNVKNPLEFKQPSSLNQKGLTSSSISYNFKITSNKNKSRKKSKKNRNKSKYNTFKNYNNPNKSKYKTLKKSNKRNKSMYYNSKIKTNFNNYNNPLISH